MAQRLRFSPARSRRAWYPQRTRRGASADPPVGMALYHLEDDPFFVVHLEKHCLEAVDDPSCLRRSILSFGAELMITRGM